MKKLFLFLLKESVCVCVCAQNFVINNSFEQFDTCPNTYSQIYRAVNWFQPCIYNGNVINSSNTDFFNSCAISTSPVDVPVNFGGYQYARTGNGYGGMAMFLNDNGREYLEGVLSDSLKEGKKYCVEFYISLANNAFWAIANIGLYFSQDSILSANYNVLPYSPQIFNPVNNILNDTSSWEKISGIYLADGGEKFITIGNFYPDSLTTLDTMSGTNPAYYYIDDVSVTLCTDTCQPPAAEFNFTTNELTATFNNLIDTTATSWQWYFGDGKTDTSQSPVHSYDSAGFYTVTLVACNQTGCCNELCCDTMVGQVSVSVGMDEFNNENYKLQIYPNPADEEFRLSLIGNLHSEKKLTVFLSDIAGRKIKEIPFNQNSIKIKTTDIDNGIYYLALYNGNYFVAVQKLVIAK